MKTDPTNTDIITESQLIHIAIYSKTRKLLNFDAMVFRNNSQENGPYQEEYKFRSGIMMKEKNWWSQSWQQMIWPHETKVSVLDHFPKLTLAYV